MKKCQCAVEDSAKAVKLADNIFSPNPSQKTRRFFCINDIESSSAYGKQRRITG